MNNFTSLSLPGKLTVGGLILAAIGILILFTTNSVTTPAVAVGPIILFIVAGVIAFGPWKWTSILGILVGLFILGGAFIAPGLFDRLGNPGQLGGFVGTWVQMIGLVTAIISGITTTMQRYGSQSMSTSR